MLFNSITFLVFLPIVLALYYLLRLRGQNLMLLAASYLFYGWWDARFLFLIALSTTVDYAVALLIDRGRLTAGQKLRCGLAVLGAAVGFLIVPWHAVDITLWPFRAAIDWEQFRIPALGLWVLAGCVAAPMVIIPLFGWLERLPEARRRRVALTCSIVASLGLLGVFKYFNFFVDSAEQLLHQLGFDPALARLEIVLPVGISFYTFQTMSYTIDVYRRQIAASERLLDFALYVAFFPQLVAGPIERATSLLPQIMHRRRITLDHLTRGCFLILLGMFQKVAIADGVAASVNSVYGAAGPAGRIDVIAATLLFAAQIYCDFAGYSNIARGTSKLMGIELMVNFRLPYFAQSPSDFWRRWHISLSSWLRDYLYIPLGGNRGGTAKTYRNLMLTMLLGGLWHGAAWNFVLWGGYQGAILCINRWITGGRVSAAAESAPGTCPGTSASFSPVSAIATLVRIGLFFLVTCYGWLLFRAGSFDQIVDFTGAIFVGGGAAEQIEMTMRRPALAAAAGIALLALYEMAQYFSRNSRVHERWPAPLRGAFYAAMLLLTIMGTSNEPAQFIYFQF